MSKTGQVHQTITELFEGGSAISEIVEITKLPTEFVESVVRHKQDEKHILTEVDYENNKNNNILG
jgi:hypothetical protein